MLKNLKFKEAEPNDLEKEIARLFETLKDIPPTDEQYASVAAQVKEFYKLKEVDSKKRVSPDTMAAIAANVFTVVAVLGYEHGHVIATKAFGFVRSALK